MTEVDQEKLGELLSAYLDGELDDQQLQWVERLLKENDSARCLYNELQQTSQLVATLPRQKIPTSIAEEFQLHQERDELLGEPITLQTDTGQRRTPFKAILSIAAAITVIVIGGFWMTRENEQVPRGPGGDVLAFAESDESNPNPIQSFEFKRGSRISSKTRSNSHPTIQSLSGEKTAGAETFQNKDLSTKLKLGTNVQAIQTHAFAGETLRLKLKVYDASDRDKLAARLVKHFSKRSIQDLSQSPGHSSMNSRSGSFYYQGKSGVNFTNKNQSQIIVRVPLEEMNNLLDELSRETDMDDRIAIAAGPLTFQGLSRARSLLQRHESARPSPGEVPSDKDLRRNKLSARRRRNSTHSSKNKSDHNIKKSIVDESFYDDMSDVFGLDRTSVEKMLQESKRKEEYTTFTTQVAPQYDADTNQTGVNSPMKIESPTSKSNVSRLRKIPIEPQPLITFVIELNMDQPSINAPAKSRRPSPVHTKDKSKTPSKSNAQ